MSHEIPIPVGAEVETAVSPAPLAGRRVARARPRGPWTVYGVRTLLVVLWLGAWELCARTFMDPFLVSMPSQIWQRLVTWFTDGTSQGSIWENIWVTLEEAAGGFVLGVLGGVILGVVLGRARFAADVLAPFIKATNAIPRIVLASLFVIWFGLGMESKIATAFVLVFFAVFFNAFQGAREVDKTLIDNARILGAGRWSLMRTIVLPSATSWILASMHVAFGFALIGAVVGEVIGASRGMGLLIQQAQGNFDSAGVYAGMVVITAVALIAESLITQLEKRLTSWRPQATSTSAAGV
jgi:NitT/TauT family transport system permease protein